MATNVLCCGVHDYICTMINRFDKTMPTVLSTTKGISAWCAIWAIAIKSGTSNLGFPMVSAYIALVLSVNASSNFFGFVESTNFTVLPNLGKV